MNDNSEMNVKVMFRSSVGGYNKKDVNKYILDENRKFATMEQECKSKVNDIENELKETREKLNQTENALSEASNKLTEKDSALSELYVILKDNEIHMAELQALLKEKEQAEKSLNDAASKYKAETEAAIKNAAVAEEKLAGMSTELTEVINNYESQIEILKAENATVEAEVAEESSDSRDIVAEELINRAIVASEEILKRAENGASIIIDRARDEAIFLKNDIISTAGDVFGAVADELHRSIGLCMNDFAVIMKTARNNNEKVVKSVEDCDDELTRRIKNMQNDLDRAIAEKLAEFDKKHGKK